MTHFAYNPAIWHNIRRLRDHLANPRFKGNKISLLIDCASGEFSIPQSIGDLEAKLQPPQKTKSNASQFKHAEMIIHILEEGGVSFEWVDSDKTIPFTEKASLILDSTLAEINRSGSKIKSGSPKEALYNCMEMLKTELSPEITSQSAWYGALQRLEAEKLLLKASPGTYLLRNGDEYTRELEYNLAKIDSFPVRCFVLTVIQKGGKISDKILIQRSNGWAVYNDDLELHNYSFQELSEIISQAGGERPLRIGKAA